MSWRLDESAGTIPQMVPRFSATNQKERVSVARMQSTPEHRMRLEFADGDLFHRTTLRPSAKYTLRAIDRPG